MFIEVTLQIPHLIFWNQIFLNIASGHEESHLVQATVIHLCFFSSSNESNYSIVPKCGAIMRRTLHSLSHLLHPRLYFPTGSHYSAGKCRQLVQNFFASQYYRKEAFRVELSFSSSIDLNTSSRLLLHPA